MDNTDIEEAALARVIGIDADDGKWYKRNADNDGWEAFQPSFVFGVPEQLNKATAEGSSEDLPRLDHGHGFASGTPLKLAGTSASEGSGDPVARLTHQHGIQSSLVGANGTLALSGDKGYIKLSTGWACFTHLT